MLILNRRRFVEGIAAGLGSAALGFVPRDGRAQGASAVLAGSAFDLEVARTSVNFTGTPGHAVTVNGMTPAPTLRWREGETVTLRVTNRLAEPTSVHWHGILVPYDMDGVPGISFAGIAPGSTFTYRFPVRQSGTYWYHSHSHFQEQLGMYGALVVEPARPDPVASDRDHTIVLSDWTDTDPMRVFQRLKKMSHYYNYNQRTLGDIRRDIAARGWSQVRAERAMWNRMRMRDSDLADVTGAAYTYLLNGVPPAGNWQALFRAGERVRLRFINAAAMTIFDVRIPGLDLTVVAADGQNVEPVTVREFRLGVAETLDVLVTPSGDSAYTIFAQSIDRFGYARGTLTPAAGLSAEVPALDRPPVLTMADMGMGAMDHAAMTDHAAMEQQPATHEHQVGTSVGQATDDEHHAAGGGAMAEHQHGGAATEAAPTAAAPEHQHGAAATGDAPATTMPGGMAGATPMAGTSDAASVRHASTEFGPGVDMRAASPQWRLDDPGVGLRDRSWPVLTYGMLRRLGTDAAAMHYDRVIELHLTGNMERYMWSFDGVPFARAEPIELMLGERVRFVLVNDTMMTHPIHLHGMWSDLETGSDGEFARKHTVLVQPGQQLAYGVTADAPGPWAYHCHLLYHMEAGMFRVVNVRAGSRR